MNVKIAKGNSRKVKLQIQSQKLSDFVIVIINPVFELPSCMFRLAEIKRRT